MSGAPAKWQPISDCAAEANFPAGQQRARTSNRGEYQTKKIGKGGNVEKMVKDEEKREKRTNLQYNPQALQFSSSFKPRLQRGVCVAPQFAHSLLTPPGAEFPTLPGTTLPTPPLPPSPALLPAPTALVTLALLSLPVEAYAPGIVVVVVVGPLRLRSETLD